MELTERASFFSVEGGLVALGILVMKDREVSISCWDLGVVEYRNKRAMDKGKFYLHQFSDC